MNILVILNRETIMVIIHFGLLRWDRWEYLVKCEDVPPDTSITNKAERKLQV